MKPLIYEGLINPWHDRRLLPGDDFSKEISSELENADVVLLLVSPDFVSSDYCWGIEMKRAIERQEAGQTRVIPVILRPVDWHTSPFGKLKALPRDGQPVTAKAWNDRDEAFLDIAEGLRKLVSPFGAAMQEIRNAADRAGLSSSAGPPLQSHVPHCKIQVECTLDNASYPNFHGTFLVFLNGSLVEELECPGQLSVDVTHGAYALKIASHSLESVQSEFELLPHEIAVVSCGATLRPDWSGQLLFLPQFLLFPAWRLADRLFGSAHIWVSVKKEPIDHQTSR